MYWKNKTDTMQQIVNNNATENLPEYNKQQKQAGYTRAPREPGEDRISSVPYLGHDTFSHLAGAASVTDEGIGMTGADFQK